MRSFCRKNHVHKIHRFRRGGILGFGGGGECTRVKWVPFVLLAFFPCFTVAFASKLAIFPLKRSVLGA